MRRWLLILTLGGGWSCAAHQAPAVPEAPRLYIIPFGARGSVCLDTAPPVQSRPCLPLEQLRRWLFSVDLPNGAKS